MTRREQLGLASAGAWSRFFELPRERWLAATAANEAPPSTWQEACQRGGFPEVALPGSIAESDRPLWFD